MNPPIPMVVWLAREREEELRKIAAQEPVAPMPQRVQRWTLSTLLLRLRWQAQR